MQTTAVGVTVVKLETLQGGCKVTCVNLASST